MSNYVPPAVQQLNPRQHPELTTGAKVSWIIVAIWNTLGCLVWGVLLIALAVGGAALMRYLSHTVSSQDYEIDSVIAGATLVIAIVVTAVAFVVSLVFTILTWKRVWPALVVQTVFAGMGALMTTLGTVGGHHAVHANGGGLLIAWVSLGLWILFTVLTSPRRSRSARPYGA